MLGFSPLRAADDHAGIPGYLPRFNMGPDFQKPVCRRRQGDHLFMDDQPARLYPITAREQVYRDQLLPARLQRPRHDLGQLVGVDPANASIVRDLDAGEADVFELAPDEQVFEGPAREPLRLGIETQPRAIDPTLEVLKPDPGAHSNSGHRRDGLA